MTDFADSWVDVQLKLNGTWTSLTDDTLANGYSRVRNNPGVEISRGKTITEQRTPPMECSFTINNSDGKYSRDNPRSTLWGQLGINTECRVVALPYEAHVRIPTRQDGVVSKNIHAPDSATLDITGDIELRIDYDPEHTTLKSFPLLTKYATTGDQRSWYVNIQEGKPAFYWSTDGTSANRRVIIGNTVIPAGRHVLRIQFDANNGSGGVTVTYSTGTSLDGPFTLLGAAVTSATTSSIHSGTADVAFGAGSAGGLPIVGDETELFTGKVYGWRIYSNLTGTLAASADFSELEFDDTTYSDGTTTWTITTTTAYVASDKVRFSGEIPSWPVVWDVTGEDVTSKITAYGLFQSLNEGAMALDSPMISYYSSLSNVGYWPGTDLSDSSVVSALTPNTRGAIPTNVDFATVGDLPGSEDVMKINEGTIITGWFPQQSNPNNEYAFTFAMYMNQAPSVDIEVLRLVTSEYYCSFTAELAGYAIEFVDTRTGNVLDSASSLFGSGAEAGNWIVFVLEAEQSGANVNWAVNWRTLDPAIGYALTGSFASSIGILRAWRTEGLPSGHGISTLGIGHIAGIHSVDFYLETDHLISFRGFAGELPSERLQRMCEDNNLEFRSIGIEKETEVLGPQPTGTVMTIFDDTVKTSRGILLEQRDRRGLLYLTRTELENQSPLTYAYSDSINSLAPKINDNPIIINDVIARRPEGGFTRSTTVSGPRGTDTIIPYQMDDTFNVQTDYLTKHVAGWIRHVGSWDDMYYKQIDYDLARNAVQDDYAILHGLINIDVGRAIEITDLPEFLPTRPASLLIEKYSENLTRSQWTITQETSAYRPYLTAQWNVYPKIYIGSSSSTLETGIDDNDTSISVETGASWVKWRFTSQFYIAIDGREKALVTAISGTTSPFTFTVTRGNPAFAHSAGVSIKLWDTRVISY